MASSNPPKEISPTASSCAGDASALTEPTGTEISSSLETWLKPNSMASNVFELVKRTGSNITNPVWKFFHIVKGVKVNVKDSDLPAKYSRFSNTQTFACCNSCGDIFVVAETGKYAKGRTHWRNTSMLSHLTSNKHSTTAESLNELIENHTEGNKKRKAQSTLHDFATSGKRNVPLKFKQQNQQLMTVKCIVDNNLPFKLVESKSFRNMIEAHNPHAKVMSNKKVKEIVINLENAMRNAAIEKMKGLSVCLTLDHWTSKAHQNYTGMTAHFIDDDWKLHNLSLGIFLHEGGSTANDLEKSFISLCLDKVKLNGIKIFACTTDTTANMNSFGMKLERMGVAHVYCTDHVLQLTCKLCYTEAEETFGMPYATSVQKARAVVTFFHKSTQATEKLKNKQKALDSFKGVPKGVIDDVVTRWWSTYDMISRLIELKSAIDIMSTEGQLGTVDPLFIHDWAHLHDISLVLKPFKESQKLLEGDKYVTASLVAQALKFIKDKLKALSQGNQPENASKALADRLIGDFETRWPVGFTPNVIRAAGNRQVGIHPYLLVATFLDPRTKSLMSVSNDAAIKIAIKEWVLELMKKSETEHRAKTSAAPATNDDSNDHDDANEDDDNEDDLFAGMKEDDEVIGGVDNINHVCDEEIRRYVAAPSLDMRNKAGNAGVVVFNDPLEWWKNNQGVYPILARLAKDYLAVQATSAPSERIFSVASRIIGARRSRMGPDIAGKVLYVSENWQWCENEINLNEALAADV